MDDERPVGGDGWPSWDDEGRRQGGLDARGSGERIRRRMEQDDWDVVIVMDDNRPAGDDGWSSWDDELALATARAAKRARRQEAAGSSAAGAARVRPGNAAARAFTVDDPDALDCSICYLPLKPPIFQCKVGHVVCSVCCDKLKARGRCHMCGVPTGSYSRCHALERLVESIHVQCPNAAHGCMTRPAYYDQQSHCQMCPHAPCHCPGEACSFISSTAALLDHVSGVHGWHCTTKIKVGDECSVNLLDGFNFLLAYRDANGSEGATATLAASNQWLFLVNVARQRLDRVISVLCIHPRANADVKMIRCSLSYSERSWHANDRHGDDQFFSHCQSSRFAVACTDIFNGLPNLDELFRFVVPNCVGCEWDTAIKVKVCIDI